MEDPTLGKPLTANQITNGVTLELSKIYSDMQIFCVFDVLCPGVLTQESFIPNVKQIQAKYKRLTKKKKKTPELEAFLAETLHVCVSASHDAQPVDKTEALNLETMSETQKKLHEKKVKEMEKKQQKMETEFSQNTAKLEEKIFILQQLYDEKTV